MTKPPPQRLPPPPSPTMEDVAHSAAKGLIGLIPAGSVVTEILAQFFAPPLEKRRDEWLKKIAEVLAELQRDRGVPVEKLGEDQAFVTLVLQATQVALRNHHQKKLDSLRNAISRGYGPDVNEDELHLFIRLIDDLSPSQLIFVWHVLAYEASPGEAVTRIAGCGQELSPELLAIQNLNALLETELVRREIYSRPGPYDRGLYVAPGNSFPENPARGLNSITEFGYRFRAFIRGGESESDREWMSKRRAYLKKMTNDLPAHALSSTEYRGHDGE